MSVFLEGFQVTVMGFLIVIVVLAFICFVLMGFSFIVKMEEQKITEKKKDDAKPQKTVVVKNETLADNKIAPQDDLELIAVITAAIAAETKTGPDKLVVRSIRRVSSWNKEAVTEQQNNIF